MSEVDVSIIVPCRNEANYIGRLLRSIARQKVDASIEVIIADGMSGDGTREVIATESRSLGFPLRVIDNPELCIPCALNKGIDAARGKWILRADAHSELGDDYIARTLQLLRSYGENAVVGGVWRIQPSAKTPIAAAIARAVAHPFGSGGATYRSPRGTGVRTVDTVPFGAFNRGLWQRLGGFDRSLLANQDYDFMVRARNAGAKVLLDPDIWSVYYARPTLRSLWRQYYRYGWWKRQMLRKHRGRSRRTRQWIPAMFVLYFILGALASPFWQVAAAFWFSGIAIYLLALFLAAFDAAGSEKRLVPGIAISFLVIHFAWGCGYWAHLVKLGSAPGLGKMQGGQTLAALGLF